MSLRTWLQDHPRLLETLYGFTRRLFLRADPLIRRAGYERADRWLRPFEEPVKRLVFDCRMCGQCILHSTGMTCPMTCPKNLRNGPCGGVRMNGHCEVIPEMRCVWVEAFERSERMTTYGPEIMLIQPPVDRRLQGDSAWINMLSGADVACPPGWELVRGQNRAERSIPLLVLAGADHGK
jgi:hypothetical protein